MKTKTNTQADESGHEVDPDPALTEGDMERGGSDRSNAEINIDVKESETLPDAAETYRKHRKRYRSGISAGAAEGESGHEVDPDPAMLKGEMHEVDPDPALTEGDMGDGGTDRSYRVRAVGSQF